MGKKKKKKKDAIDVLLTLGMVVCACVFVFAAYKLISAGLEYKQAKDEYTDLKKYTSQATPDPDQTSDTSQEPLTAETIANLPPDVDFMSLQAINPDVIGWLVVDALDISYPIVQGKDNDEYLHHTFEKTYNFAGSIFMDYANKSDLSDCHTIIYGHNMKDQSMFGKLKFIKEKELYKNDPYFWIITPQGKSRYQMFSAHVTSSQGDTYTLFSGADQQFVDYMNKMALESEVDLGKFSFTAEDKAVTLTTCTSNSTQRFVVQGVLVDTW
ncbi:MAG: class B sortase [Lachnospiraceae bacterium]|nr:class B sortase [Lachnospiraceae bacterium]